MLEYNAASTEIKIVVTGTSEKIDSRTRRIKTGTGWLYEVKYKGQPPVLYHVVDFPLLCLQSHPNQQPHPPFEWDIHCRPSWNTDVGDVGR